MILKTALIKTGVALAYISSNGYIIVYRRKGRYYIDFRKVRKRKTYIRESFLNYDNLMERLKRLKNWYKIKDSFEIVDNDQIIGRTKKQKLELFD